MALNQYMKISNKPFLINACLFQLLWFAAIYGSAQGWLWPSLLLLAILAYWQLQPSRRAASDSRLMLIAFIMGLVIDSIWINLGLLSYSHQQPFSFLSPFWILALWIGLALTLNHSMAWLKIHPLLPALLGLISAPLSYFAGVRFGAVIYLQEPLLVSAYIGLAWAIALPILVRCSDAPSSLAAKKVS